MKLMIQLASLALLLGMTGCVVPVRERSYVRYETPPPPYHYHHWEHRGYEPHPYGYYHDGR